MKVKWGALIVDGRGKIGGQVASKNGAGAYMKNKSTPTNPQTMAQTLARALFAVISAGWSSLTATQREAWNTAVPDWTKTDIFGDMKKPSGKSLYQRLNNQAQSVGFSPVLNVPSRAALPNNPITEVLINTTTFIMTLTGASTSATDMVVVWGAAPVSAGTSNVKSKMRQVYSELGNAYDETEAYSRYEAKFGEPVVGQHIFVGVKYVLASGQASPLQIIKATITA